MDSSGSFHKYVDIILFFKFFRWFHFDSSELLLINCVTVRIFIFVIQEKWISVSFNILTVLLSSLSAQEIEPYAIDDHKKEVSIDIIVTEYSFVRHEPGVESLSFQLIIYLCKIYKTWLKVQKWGEYVSSQSHFFTKLDSFTGQSISPKLKSIHYHNFKNIAFILVTKTNQLHHGEGDNIKNFICENIKISYLRTLPLGQDMTQGQFLSGV